MNSKIIVMLSFLAATTIAHAAEDGVPTLAEFQTLLESTIPADITRCDVENSEAEWDYLADRSVFKDNFPTRFDVAITCDGTVVYMGQVGFPKKAESSSNVSMIIGRTLIAKKSLRLVECRDGAEVEGAGISFDSVKKCIYSR